ncbi:MAG: DUF2169 domain-containing protein [Candidatus Eisenbacteria bacterium]
MLSISNATRYAVSVVPASDPSGAEVLLAVVRATFRVVKLTKLELAPEQVPPTLADEYADEPGKSSLVAASDFAVRKPGADVIVLGHAHAPGGKPVTELDVRIEVGDVATRLRVFGDRSWKRALLGLSPSRPEPFRKMPLAWERAFGGTCAAAGRADGEDRLDANPVGAGFWRNEKDAVDQPLPNLEDPGALVKSWKDQPGSAGTGFVAPDWEPRRAFAGTYDAAWERDRMPLLPDDFDERFWQCAPAALQAAAPFRGGERVRLSGLHPAGEIAFELPRDQVTVDVLLPAERVATHAAVLDTLVLQPDEERVSLVWRACIPAPRPITSVRAVCVRSTLHPAPLEEAARG